MECAGQAPWCGGHTTEWSPQAVGLIDLDDRVALKEVNSALHKELKTFHERALWEELRIFRERLLEEVRDVFVASLATQQHSLPSPVKRGGDTQTDVTVQVNNYGPQARIETSKGFQEATQWPAPMSDSLLVEVRKQHADMMKLIREEFAARGAGVTKNRSMEDARSRAQFDPSVSPSGLQLALDSPKVHDGLDQKYNNVEAGKGLSQESPASPKVVEPNDDPPTHVALQESSSLASVFSNDCDVDRPAYHVEDFYWKTGSMQRIAKSSIFEHATVGVVSFNALYIGFDSDYNNAQNIYNADLIFQICSQFFCVYFTFELVVRFLAFQRKRSCLNDGWFKFDAFLVSTMILDTWVLMPILTIVGGGVTIPTQPLRMLRLFKLTRMARLMRAFPELVTMIKGLVRSLRAISSSMILVAVMVYVWGIMMHMLMKEEKEFNERQWEEAYLSFATMIQCIWSLLVAGTLLLDGGSALMTELLFTAKMNYQIAGAMFVVYALLSAMLILQMLIGVLCDVVSQVQTEQKDASCVGLVKQELLHALKGKDRAGDGTISQEELFEVMHDEKSKAVLHKLRVNRPFLLALQKMMFTKEGMKVSIKHVIELMIMCRGDEIVTVEAMAGTLLSLIKEMNEMKSEMMQVLQEVFLQETQEKKMMKDMSELKSDLKQFVEAYTQNH